MVNIHKLDTWPINLIGQNDIMNPDTIQFSFSLSFGASIQQKDPLAYDQGIFSTQDESQELMPTIPLAHCRAPSSMNVCSTEIPLVDMLVTQQSAWGTFRF